MIFKSFVICGMTGVSLPTQSLAQSWGGGAQRSCQLLSQGSFFTATLGGRRGLTNPDSRRSLPLLEIITGITI